MESYISELLHVYLFLEEIMCSPCRKDQFAVSSYFSTSLILLTRSTTGRSSTTHWFVAVDLLIFLV